MKQETVAVKGMHCASCATTISKTLKKVDGVNDIDVNYGTEKAYIEYDLDKTNLSDLSKRIEAFGYSFDLQNHSTLHSFSNSTLLQNNDAKREKLLEISRLKEKVEFTLPLTLFVFLLMMWEILARTYISFPKFFIPMELYNIVIFFISSIILFWVGSPFIKAVFNSIKFRVANMDTLIGIGTLTAYLYSTLVVLFPQIRDLLKLPEITYFDVTIVVIGFITLGKYLESRSKLKTGEAIEKLINLQAKTAVVERNGKEIEISVDQVELQDIIIIKPGSKIPVDGEIIEGKSSIDESMVTGESIPTDKAIGDLVIGGTINKQGFFKFKATKIGSETMLSNIIKMVEHAQGSKAPIQKLADKISSIFVPIVLIIALLTLVLWLTVGPQFMSFENSLSLGLVCFVGILVIACPCALGLATPTAIIVGVGKGAQSGILIKDAKSLEKLHKVNVLVVDKTGTITKGKPEVTDILLFNNSLNNKEVLNIVGSLEKLSEHPLAEAIVNKSIAENVKFKEVKDFEIIEGKGLKGKIKNREYFVGNLKLLKDLNIKLKGDEIDKLTREGKTPVILMDSQSVLAIIAIADTIKDDAFQAINTLHHLGVKVVMLTGDNKNTANYIANQIGIDDVFAEVSPLDKSNKIKELQNNGNIVAMAGDGVNDAPALAQSDVGIAMGTGTDIAIESADITLLNGDISKIAKAIKLSKLTMKTVKQNLFWAFIYNIVGIPLAAGVFYPIFGWLLNPIFAGLAMAFSSVSVVGNSLRLKTKKI